MVLCRSPKPCDLGSKPSKPANLIYKVYLIMRDMVGYEDRYSITEDGQVWSKLSKKFLSLHKTASGYLTFATKIGGRDGVPKCFKVHRLVAEAYIPNPENKPHINHKDGNKENNSASNLEWVTTSENMRHAYATGLNEARKGFDNPKSKLSKDDIAEIRRTYIPRSRVYGARALSKKFGVSHTTIQNIVNGKIYIAA